MGTATQPAGDDGAAAGSGGRGADDGELAVPGDTPVHELVQRLGLATWPAGSGQEPVTVAGVLIAHFHRIPRPGEQLVLNGVRLRVIDADRRVVRRVGVRPVPPPQS